MPTFGQLLARGMTDKGLKARKLAEAIGYKDYRQIYRWCRDEYSPEVGVLQRIVEVLGLDPLEAYCAAKPEACWFLAHGRCVHCGQVVGLDDQGRYEAHPFPADSGIEGDCDATGLTPAAAEEAAYSYDER